MPDNLDAVARAQGFRNYAEMRAFMARRSESLQNSHTVVGPSATQAPTAPPQQSAPVAEHQPLSAFQRLMQAFSGVR